MKYMVLTLLACMSLVPGNVYCSPEQQTKSKILTRLDTPQNRIHVLSLIILGITLKLNKDQTREQAWYEEFKKIFEDANDIQLDENAQLPPEPEDPLPQDKYDNQVKVDAFWVSHQYQHVANNKPVLWVMNTISAVIALFYARAILRQCNLSLT